MLRTLVLTILLTFTANSAFALSSLEVIDKGKIIASGGYVHAQGMAGAHGVSMAIKYKGNMYNCALHNMVATCYKIKNDMSVKE